MEIPAPDQAARAELRRLVFGLRSGQRRRIFPARIHLGDPEGEQREYADEGAPLDAGLRADVLHTLLDGLEEGAPLAVWLTRVGWPEPHDFDRLWVATALQVAAERDEQPRWIAVITKNGWYDPLGGDCVVWKRLRIR